MKIFFCTRRNNERSNDSGSFVFSVPDEPDACKKENGTYNAGKNNGFDIFCICTAIYKTEAGIN